jgi:hypothetical protein
MKIPESKRSEIRIIAEFRGIPNGSPNLVNIIYIVQCRRSVLLIIWQIHCIHYDGSLTVKEMKQQWHEISDVVRSELLAKTIRKYQYSTLYYAGFPTDL